MSGHGHVAGELAAEYPGLRLRWRVVEARPGRSAPSVRERLRALSDGHRGSAVIAERTHAIPQAYRGFFRQIGLNPDVDRTPAEQAAVQRLLDGRFRPTDLVADARLVALVETGVGVWAADAERVIPAELELRISQAGERLGSGAEARPLAAGRLVIADPAGPVALLFGEVGTHRAVTDGTRRIVLYTLGVHGVPDIHLEEALWIAAEALEAG